MAHASGEEITYTVAQAHGRLGEEVPKPTIRYWTAEYSEFLSEGANPGDGRNRVFTYNDLVILNTVRHLTKREGLHTTDDVRAALKSGRRVTAFPEARTEEEQDALEGVRLIPLAQLERALDQIRFYQEREGFLDREIERLKKAFGKIEEERNEALVMLDEHSTTITQLKEQRGQIRGTMLGMATATVGILIISIFLIILVIKLLP